MTPDEQRALFEFGIPEDPLVDIRVTFKASIEKCHGIGSVWFWLSVNLLRICLSETCSEFGQRWTTDPLQISLDD